MSSAEHDSKAAVTASVDRRTSPRFQVLERIHAEVRSIGMPIRLLDMSQSGFLMQASEQFPIGETHEFHFSVDNEEAIVMKARIVRGMRASAGGVPSYVLGLEFIDRGTAATEKAIDSLMVCLQRTR